MFEILTSPDALIALLTLTFLEIILGIDNIIFISLAASKLPKEHQKKATNIGLFLAMIIRIILLFGISWLVAMEAPFWHINLPWVKAGISGQGVILFIGGLFLLYKSTNEIHEKVEDKGHDEREVKKGRATTLSKAVIQICLINIVFSFDSILTAVGMTNGVGNSPTDALIIMVIAVIVSVLIMMIFAAPVGRFVNEHPTVQLLGLSFLILIGFMLIAEGAHLSHLEIFGSEVGVIPKGYLYFTIAFSLFIEFINMKYRKRTSGIVTTTPEKELDK
ncbi:TerC family protein [Ulvibacter litoralis]|uniref:Membrane protein TerC, possibly involved in tellurium resistance n=1 Tax=Ulvibacter litoralis TaxID=227084 RepID=A0A1G7FB60_9FLAO|nr:TerC family protein [Ulvibacter litoralis]GHC51924.1 membrane protein [Ulvibacter litoralis]SDE73094.1 Membrane protein TerC, possibly involved in tellurium resistance [Ulvibacter litoralis]